MPDVGVIVVGAGNAALAAAVSAQEQGADRVVVLEKAPTELRGGNTHYSGITFTFGGVRINDRAQVMSTGWAPVAGLYACGEMVGGLFHGNYPGGTGLMSGAVFGRIAGHSAATVSRG